jgi:hypothetical protein
MLLDPSSKTFLYDILARRSGRHQGQEAQKLPGVDGVARRGSDPLPERVESGESHPEIFDSPFEILRDEADPHLP